ncbi:acyltransferase family protein [Arthrobacter sunyaminii]|uniref:Acyltransferase n=1 Tax=Arthrobacter sunyaminii TaxID=2816859 RepID=A0A975S7E7_9MICC|nr:acyltransferase [Arthrobacter sunyaminii]MBO0908193.1 acyltransferase [Arthrobacter sunyaminii]QWQ37198.1 acyltransferase [Arthrobacter sunyaminii]
MDAQEILKGNEPLKAAALRKTRDISIDSLRGIAVLLMVAGHVIGSASDRGMDVPDDSAWRYFYVALEDIRMPLFAALSGYIYARRRVWGPEAMGALISGKVRRLLVPLITVGAAFLLAQMIIPFSNSEPGLSDFWKMFVYGGEHLWFLQAMFLIFVFVGALDMFDVLSTLKRWAIVFGSGSAAFVLVSIPSDANVFSLNGAIRLLPFFLLGYGLRQFDITNKNRRILIFCVPMFAAVYTIRLYTVLSSYEDTNPAMRILELCVGLFAITALILLRSYLCSRPLAWLGKYSFSIYLLHLFASAGTSKILNQLGVDSNFTLFLVGMIVAVGFPIIFEKTIGRVNWISWAVLGQRTR